MSEQTLEKILRDLRPKLHRFCSRMVGSVLDGEDLVQETLAEAFIHLPSLRDVTRLEPWLFRIAHHKCVDFIRRERRHPVEALPDDIPVEPNEPIDEPLAMLVGVLPPKERASVLLKDVLDYHLDEVAEMVDSTVGGVKAALHRARAKLRAVRDEPRETVIDESRRPLLDAYVDRFNRHDWDGLRELIQADARLELVGEVAGTMLDIGRNYFSNYVKLPFSWRFAVDTVGGELVAVLERRVDGEWRRSSAIRLWWRDGKVVHIRDYVHVDYLWSTSGLTSG